MAIGSEKYVAFTTYRKDGTPKTLPVWIADLGDGNVGFTTSGESWKAKRLRNDPRVQLQPSDSRGNPRPGTEPIDGTAELVEGAEFQAVRRAIASKYGLQFRMISVFSKVAGFFGRRLESDRGVVVSLAD